MARKMQDSGSDYIRAAEVLERQDRLAEMEALVQQAGNAAGHPWPAVPAALYRRRLMRMLEEGRREEAIAARQNAISSIRAYASGATSGGEGLALSREEDTFIANLPPVA